MKTIAHCKICNKRNRFFLLLLLLILFVFRCSSGDKTGRTFNLNPPLHTAIQYSLSKSYSEPDRASRNSFDSIVFTIIFVEVADSILSCKLYLNYLGSQFPGGRKISTADSVSDKNWGRDYILAISFLERQVLADSFWVVLQTNGTILRVDGFDSIVNRLSARFDIDKRTVRSFLKERVGNEALKDMLSQIFFYLPGKAVKKNDNWIRNVGVTVKAPMKYSNFIKVRNINHDTIVLNVQSAVTAKTGEGGTIYEQGKRTIEMHVSHLTGLPIEWSGMEETVYTAQGTSIRKKALIKGKRI